VFFFPSERELGVRYSVSSSKDSMAPSVWPCDWPGAKKGRGADCWAAVGTVIDSRPSGSTSCGRTSEGFFGCGSGRDAGGEPSAPSRVRYAAFLDADGALKR